MTTLPAVSGSECIRALARAGFRAIGSAAAPAVLAHDGRAVVVPDVPVIDYETLQIILRGAGITGEQFLELLERSIRSIRVAQPCSMGVEWMD